MIPIQKPLRRAAVLAYTGSEDSLPQAAAITEFLLQNGLEECVWGKFHDPDLEDRVSRGEFDLLIALGGDGTMLRAGKLSAQSGTPILGVNLGKFGFLAEVQRAEWREKLQELLAGRYWIESRMLLQARHLHQGAVVEEGLVVNDLVACRGRIVRPIRVRAQVDGHELTTYVADGVIASTPTGSTAYALAVGGPILPPMLRNMLLIPVAPHLTMDRGIVLAEGAVVELTVYTDHEAVISIDGRPPTPVLDGDTVTIETSPLSMSFIHFGDAGYFYRNISAYMAHNPSTEGLE